MTPAATTKPLPWSHARPWQTNLALALLGTLLFLLSRHLPSEYETFNIGFSGTSGWSVWCYALACLLVLFGPTDRLTFPLILTVTVTCRLTLLFSDPVLSSDIYRYVWDGIVQHAGINPFRYVPADPALGFLRGASEGNIFPMINRADYAHTIYPPFAQILFFVITYISPTITCMKTVLVLFEGLTLWALVQILRHLGRPREQAILYAWCPLLLWEIAGSGHLDAAVIALTTLALLFRLRRQRLLTGLFLGLAVLTKFYPLVLFPALYLLKPAPEQGSDPPPTRPNLNILRRLDWHMPATMLALALVLYAAYSSVGLGVFGFLHGYVQEEGMSTGTRYFLLEQAQHLPGLQALSPRAYSIFAAAILLAVAAGAFLRSNALTSSAMLFLSPATQHLPSLRFGAQPQRKDARVSPARAAILLETPTRLDQIYASAPDPTPGAPFLLPALALAWALMLLFSPHYPWYIAWLIPFLCLLPNLPLAAYILGFFYLCTTALAVGAGPKQFLLNQILYGGLLLATLLHLALRRWPPYRQLQTSN